MKHLINNLYELLKYLWKNRTMHLICFSVSVISILFICVDEKFLQGFIPCIDYINPDIINKIGAIIGGSFIAGYVFYLFTTTIPNGIRMKQTKRLILNHINLLSTYIDICKTPINELQNFIKDKDDIVLNEQKDVYIKIKESILELENKAKPLVLNSLNPIYRYFSHLSPSEQGYIENIENSVFFIWSNYLKDKQQIYINEIKILIDKYDELKTNVVNLKESVE